MRPFKRPPKLLAAEALWDYGLKDVSLIPVGLTQPEEPPIVSKPLQPTLLFVGRLASNKRPDHALEAFDRARTKIPELLSQNKDLQTIIAADKGIAYGDVVHVVDLVKTLGVHKFALNTEATQ